MHFADLVKDSKSIAGFSCSRQFLNLESEGMTSHKHGLAAKCSFKFAAFEVASFETNFFRIADTSEAETSVSGKAECLFAIGQDKKVSFLKPKCRANHSQYSSKICAIGYCKYSVKL